MPFGQLAFALLPLPTPPTPPRAAGLTSAITRAEQGRSLFPQAERRVAATLKPTFRALRARAVAIPG
eukprot:9187633-Alexandrium_andersonii.AAC.1